MAGNADIGADFSTPYGFLCGATKEISNARGIVVLSCTIPRGHRGPHECKRIIDLDEGGNVTTSFSAVSRWEDKE